MTLYAVERLGISVAGASIVEAMHFTVEAGRCTALVGASGSGKSLSCLAPFGLSAGIAAGSARFEGRELIGLSEAERRPIRARAGFVFQHPLTALTPHLRVGEQLSEAATALGAPRPDRRALAAMLDRVGLTTPEAKLDAWPHRLSGGERQRVLIAAAVAHGPPLLIADEPTSALDATLRHAIRAGAAARRWAGAVAGEPRSAARRASCRSGRRAGVGPDRGITRHRLADRESDERGGSRADCGNTDT